MITLIQYLQKQYDHAFEMVKFAETKNTTLVAFNGAIIIGALQLLKDISNAFLTYYCQYTIIMCVISIFICFSSLIAKIKHKPIKSRGTKNTNLMYFATLADLSPAILISKLKNEYGCVGENDAHEIDVAKQVIITSQIATRKYKLFNLAISFMFSGLLTPLILLVYDVFLDHDK